MDLSQRSLSRSIDRAEADAELLNRSVPDHIKAHVQLITAVGADSWMHAYPNEFAAQWIQALPAQLSAINCQATAWQRTSFRFGVPLRALEHRPDSSPRLLVSTLGAACVSSPAGAPAGERGRAAGAYDERNVIILAGALWLEGPLAPTSEMRELTNRNCSR